ncbi:MAG TPA: hypothetical protein VFK79_06765 [Xanthobacteraceae bacterium]|nr:hypothetical protein [Xanthobacteraceae bacterium]
MSYFRNRSALSATIALTILVGTTWTATAQPPRNATGPTPPSAADADAALAPVTTVNKVLRHSRFTSENVPAAIGSGFVAMTGVITVNCPGPGQCLLEVDQHANVRGTVANNVWAICTKVDGVFMNNPNCPFLGVIPSTNQFVAGAFVQTKSVSAGDHAVQTFIYTLSGGTRGIYQVTHRIYKNN